MLAISRMLRMERDPDANLTALELLQRTPLEQLEQTVKALKKHRPAAEVRQAMVQLIAAAPLSDFGTLKQIYMTHCADAK
jgi:16S rRNA C1402 N4-methylase RsmH